jgi:hypothetical protein
LGTLTLAVGTVPLLDALGFLELLAETNVDKLPSAALRCHGRFELEATMLMIAESRPHCPRSARCAPVIAKPSMCSAAAASGAANVDLPDRLGSLDAEQATGRCSQNVWPWFCRESDHTPHVAVHRKLGAGQDRLRCLIHGPVDAAVRILQRDLDLHCHLLSARSADNLKHEAIALVDDAADSTAYLVTRTPHYSWMRSRR